MIQRKDEVEGVTKEKSEPCASMALLRDHPGEIAPRPGDDWFVVRTCVSTDPSTVNVSFFAPFLSSKSKVIPSLNPTVLKKEASAFNPLVLNPVKDYLELRDTSASKICNFPHYKIVRTQKDAGTKNVEVLSISVPEEFLSPPRGNFRVSSRDRCFFSNK